MRRPEMFTAEDPHEQERSSALAEEIEAAASYREYRSQRVSIEKLRDLLPLIDAQIEASSAPEQAREARELLREKIDEVAALIERYHQLKAEWVRFSFSYSYKNRQDSENFSSRSDWQQKMQALENARHRAHNVLLDTLRLITRLCIGPMPSKSETRSFPDLGITIPPRSVFSFEELENRNFIGEWATLNAIGARLDQEQASLRNSHENS